MGTAAWRTICMTPRPFGTKSHDDDGATYLKFKHGRWPNYPVPPAAQPLRTHACRPERARTHARTRTKAHTYTHTCPSNRFRRYIDSSIKLPPPPTTLTPRRRQRQRKRRENHRKSNTTVAASRRRGEEGGRGPFDPTASGVGMRRRKKKTNKQERAKNNRIVGTTDNQ